MDAGEICQLSAMKNEFWALNEKGVESRVHNGTRFGVETEFYGLINLLWGDKKIAMGAVR